jgi:transposase
VRRFLAIATILDGSGRSDAAVIGSVTRQIVRDWVVRFNTDGPEGLTTRKAPGPQTILNAGHRRALEEIIEAGPIPAAHGVVHWRIIDLAQWLGTSSGCRSARKPSGMSCGPWAIANSRPGRATTGSALRILRFLKSLSHPSGANHPQASERNACRTVVAGRSPRRPADQAHPTLGKAWHPPLCAEGSAPVLGMDIWGDLSR